MNKWAIWLIVLVVSFGAMEAWSVVHSTPTLSEFVWRLSDAFTLFPFLAGLLTGGLAVHFWWGGKVVFRSRMPGGLEVHPPDISRKLDLILNQQEKIMANIDALTAQVAANAAVIDSAIVLINGIAARIDAAGVDPVKLAALVDELKAKDTELAGAVTANTPAQV